MSQIIFREVCNIVLENVISAPITLMGADLWTCYGTKCDNSQKEFFTFKSVDERRRGRCSYQEGQLPYFLYWPFL